MILTTERLRLEPFAPAHRDGLYAMNSDIEVMRFISGRPQSMRETDRGIGRIQDRWARLGYGWWTWLSRADGAVVGAGCIQNIEGDKAQPLEIGWRLHRDRWRQGFAIEAARAMAGFAFDRLGIEMLLAVAHPENTTSTDVMRRLGMRRRGIETHYGEACATYEITRDEWARRAA